ncbi:alpha/beta fold hydrolase [Promethearchaeum syntrophicum]|uniref:Alpha/beta fold hydrolase n=1 Tax=Promethearchaeum syntrophicum TaxID=2594042 RepID=A0A5B9DDX5_9ARCH|nr:alpha/beta hydrolase [Candidatus Prometheoarchaeum syntrophicum]QEE17519.1 acyl-CoA esterase [Candidatus Prometheoarchaeum syntrophicum]
MNKCKSKDGTDIYYEVHGKGDITLCFVSGAGGILEHWKLQHSFAKQYKLVLPDIGGHGKSATTDRLKFTMQAFGEDIAAVIQAEDLQRVILIGWSMGGPIILEAARILKDRIIGIIGIDTFFPIQGSLYTKNTVEATELIMKDFRENTHKKIVNLYKTHMNSGIKVSEQLQKEFLQYPIIKNAVFLSEFEELCYWNVIPYIEEARYPIKAIIAGLSLPKKKHREKFKPKIDTIFMEGHGHCMFWADHHTFNSHLQQLISDILYN